MTTIGLLVASVAGLGAVSGVLLLRNGRMVLGRLLVLVLCLPPVLLLVDSARTGQWFAAVFAGAGVALATVAAVGIPKVVVSSRATSHAD
ncbi:hypothetical protein [Nocardia suismassiliense]|uniref:hypothetical protein n=1 Tax=Nocardia suismassiliense TaxID=2077092 RepID=UPI00131F45BE|nr:hypothetical protein [Nocardia suismassiliense]